MQRAVERLVGYVAEDRTSPARVVVTPNLDHAVMLRSNVGLRDAYARADLVVADGMPFIWSSRLKGTPLPERVAGSDLVPALLSSLPKGTRVFLLGATEESSKKCALHIEQTYPGVSVCGRLSPPFGFEHSEEWSNVIVDELTKTQAQVVIVGFGAPKQELWVNRHRDLLPGMTFLCAGATIDFLAGSVNRAPQWTHRLGLEWLYRLMKDPRRLATRYGRDALYLPLLVLEDVAARWTPRAHKSE